MLEVKVIEKQLCNANVSTIRGQKTSDNNIATIKAFKKMPDAMKLLADCVVGDVIYVEGSMQKNSKTGYNEFIAYQAAASQQNDEPNFVVIDDDTILLLPGHELFDPTADAEYNTLRNGLPLRF